MEKYTPSFVILNDGHNGMVGKVGVLLFGEACQGLSME
jgi:hypothetical protein